MKSLTSFGLFNEHGARSERVTSHPRMVRSLRELTPGTRYEYHYCAPVFKNEEDTGKNSHEGYAVTLLEITSKEVVLKSEATGYEFRLNYALLGFAPYQHGEWEHHGHLKNIG